MKRLFMNGEAVCATPTVKNRVKSRQIGKKGRTLLYNFGNQRYGTLGAIHPTMDFFDGEIRSFRVDPL